VPLTKCLTKKLLPFITPKTPSMGPLTNPYMGWSNNSYTPKPIDFTNYTGLPIIFIDPKMTNADFIIASL